MPGKGGKITRLYRASSTPAGQVRRGRSAQMWVRGALSSLYAYSVAALRTFDPKYLHAVNLLGSGQVGRYRQTALRLERARYRLRRAAELDPLTGLYNRRGFWGQAERILEAANSKGTPFAAMFVDIDRVKEINDRYGHAAGDAAITDTAALLRRVLRTDDPIARLGGDEICAILTSTADPASMRARIMDALGQLNENREHPLSLSVGFADYDPATPCSIDELLQRGDIAMYEHKRARSSRSEPVRR